MDIGLATAMSAGINALGGIFTNNSNAQYNAQEAEKNRQFQREMYDKQVQDNINFWKMQADYALPSAELQRIRDAGLNPLLYYDKGGMSTQVTAPQPAQAPHGAQSSVHFNNPIDMANLALIEAQVKNINADTGQKEAATEGQNIENEVSAATKQIKIAIKYRDLDLLNTTMDQMRNDIYNSRMITTQQVLTMMQGREYQIKHYNLSEYEIGQNVLIGWKQAANGEIAAKASMKSAFAQMLQAVTAQQIAPYQIGVLQKNAALLGEQARTEKGLRPFRIVGQKYSNYNQVFDMLTKGAGLSKIQAETLQIQLNTMKSSLGVDSYLGGVLAPFTMPMGFPKHGQTYHELQQQFNKH